MSARKLTMSLPFSNYISLAGEAKQIRLLHLGKRGSSQVEEPNLISCTFSTVSLDEYPEYEALSYVWGDTIKEKTIQIDNEAVGITRNLHEALTQLQLPDRERVLWADAVCINQDDDLERTHQVSIMQHIFKRATKVVIYLGPTWVGCEELFEFFQTIGQDPGLHIVSHQEPCDSVRGFRGITPELRKSMGKFFDFAWWTRVWTVQEFVLAKSADIHCGTHVLSGDVLFESVDNILYHTFVCCHGSGMEELDGDTGLSTLRSLKRLRPIKYMRASGHSSTIIALVSSFRLRKAHDHRDKIFGLLGLLPATYVGAIIPDYKRSVAEIYYEVVMVSVSTTGTLDFLNHCYGELRFDFLPSFIPDWTALIDENREDYRRHRVVSLSCYNASNGTAAEVQFVSSAEANFKGIIFDVVNETGPILSAPVTENFMQSWHQFAGVEVRSVERSKIDVTEEELEFPVTLCGGMETDDKEGMTSLCGASLKKAWLSLEKFEAWVASGFNRTAFDTDVDKFSQAYIVATIDKRLAKTSKNNLALVPETTQEGDVIAILAGGRVPYVLRPALTKNDDDASCRLYTFVGDAYVYGIMDGQAWPKDSSELSVIRMI
jgi:hypothetical protein